MIVKEVVGLGLGCRAAVSLYFRHNQKLRKIKLVVKEVVKCPKSFVGNHKFLSADFAP